MTRKSRIIGLCWIAALLFPTLLLPSCTRAPGRLVPLERARASLQQQYPRLLQSFDLHLGEFSVDEAAWEALTPDARTGFVTQCRQARLSVTGRAPVTIRAEDEVLATHDGCSTVYYGRPSVASTGRELAGETPGADDAAAGPVLVSIPRPVYPAEALHRGVQGTVVVQVRVDSDGSAKEIELVDAGIALLNSAALESARQARFRAWAAADPQETVWVRIPMNFTIRTDRRPDLPGPEPRAGGVADAGGAAWTPAFDTAGVRK